MRYDRKNPGKMVVDVNGLLELLQRRGIYLNPTTLLAELRELLKPLVGKPSTRESLEEAVELICKLIDRN